MAPQLSESNDLLSKLRENGAYSDLLIRCGDAEFRVHKCIVCPQSSFFRNACKEGRWKEGETGIIELKAVSDECPDAADDDPRAVKLMIDYLYLGDYDPATADEYESLHTVGKKAKTLSTEPEIDASAALSSEHAKAVPADQDPNLDEFWDSWAREKTELDTKSSPLGTDDLHTTFLEMHAKMFVIASKYDIKPLRDAAFKKLKCQTKLDWQGPDLIAAMSIVFSQTPESRIKLRNIFKNVIVKHAHTLVRVSGFQEAVADIEGLAYDLFLRQTKSIG